MKIRWSELVERIKELEASEFTKTRMGVVRRQSPVVKVKATRGGTIIIFLRCGKAYVFWEKITWAFLAPTGRIILRREGERPGTIFAFSLRTPFLIRELADAELIALQQRVMSRL